MGSGNEWDAEKMFQLYLHDYMLKKNMHDAAEVFAKEANVTSTPVVIDAPGSFLSEWWTLFYDVFNSRQTMPHEHGEASGVKDSVVMQSKQSTSSTLVPQLQMNQLRQSQVPVHSELSKMLAQPTPSMAVGRLYDEGQHRQTRHDDPNLHIPDVDKLRISRSPVNFASSSQQQIPKQAQQLIGTNPRHSSNLGRMLPGDATLSGIPRGTIPRNGPLGSGANNPINPVTLRGWPVMEVDQIGQGSGNPFLSSLFQVPNQQRQVHMPGAPQQEVIGQVFPSMPGNSILSSSPVSGLTSGGIILPKSDYEINEQEAGNHPQSDQLLEYQLQEASRKRKSSSHLQPGDQGLGLEDKSAEIVDCFLSYDDAIADVMATPFSVLQQSSASSTSIEYKDFSFEEVCHFNSTKGKVLCCHFSSNGRFLAAAGHEKKVTIWNTETHNIINTPEGHGHLITDLRFRPNSMLFGTTSFDKTVQIWDAARPIKPIIKLFGHAEHVMSLDFHPRKFDVLCSCDSNSEIRLWNVNNPACIRITKGANRQVRFQPRVGKLLAAAGGNGISVIDVETDCIQLYMKGHVGDVRSICWDSSGKYIASVSEDSARIWSIASAGKCIHELRSHGNKFESCTFHPGHPLLLVIGGYQSLELWNPTQSCKTVTVQAHSGIIAGLADSPATKIIASASHDHSVKLWK